MLLKGKIYWAKIVGQPQPGYDKTKKEWSFDLSIDMETVRELKTMGLIRLIKNKEDDRGDFIKLKRRALKSDGTPAQPIKIVDHHNNPWDGRLIGNGSTINVSVAINTFKVGGKDQQSLSPIAVQIWDLVEYKGRDEFPTDTDRKPDTSPEAW